jgi:DHA1 family bicyclomycin/chloramphenicol resistance-like MFS transporter
MTTRPAQAMSKAEFISLVAMMMATIAFSIDAMLPALPEIGAQLSPNDVNQAQLILTSFVLGMGIGTFFTGPLSDAFGRKPVIIAGALVYVLSAGVAWASSSLELVLFARVTMGLGAAGPRVVALAIVRDLYSGREMARMMSIAMMIFTLVPAVAPMLGQFVILIAGWRGIFAAFALFAIIISVWTMLRLPEPLAVENRRPFRVPLMLAAVKEMVQHPTVRLSILVQTLCLAILFTMITMVQQIYDIIFDRADSFPFWFSLVALMSHCDLVPGGANCPLGHHVQPRKRPAPRRCGLWAICGLADQRLLYGRHHNGQSQCNGDGTYGPYRRHGRFGHWCDFHGLWSHHRSAYRAVV